MMKSMKHLIDIKEKKTNQTFWRFRDIVQNTTVHLVPKFDIPQYTFHTILDIASKPQVPYFFEHLQEV